MILLFALRADRKCVSPPHLAIPRADKERVGLQCVYPFVDIIGLLSVREMHGDEVYNESSLNRKTVIVDTSLSKLIFQTRTLNFENLKCITSFSIIQYKISE